MIAVGAGGFDGVVVWEGRCPARPIVVVGCLGDGC